MGCIRYTRSYGSYFDGDNDEKHHGIFCWLPPTCSEKPQQKDQDLPDLPDLPATFMNFYQQPMGYCHPAATSRGSAKPSAEHFEVLKVKFYPGGSLRMLRDFILPGSYHISSRNYEFLFFLLLPSRPSPTGSWAPNDASDYCDKDMSLSLSHHYPIIIPLIWTINMNH